MTESDRDGPAEIVLRAREIGFTADEIADLDRVYAMALSRDPVSGQKSGNQGPRGRKESRKSSSP